MSKTPKNDSPKKASACGQDDHFPDHKSDLHRLKRINGQIEGISRMIIENRYCPDILVQTRAVMSASRSLEASLLERHLNHCVRSAFESENENESQAKVAELVDIFRSRMPK
jgi:CsoR family transcriptional regulator, copper-sensing transcriptional repressor